MYICKGWLDLYITSQPNSLKGKRRVIRSLKERIWNRFKISVAEVGRNNLWQRAEIGIAFVTRERIPLEQMFERLIKFIDAEEDVEVVDVYKEVEKIK